MSDDTYVNTYRFIHGIWRNLVEYTSYRGEGRIKGRDEINTFLFNGLNDILGAGIGRNIERQIENKMKEEWWRT